MEEDYYQVNKQYMSGRLGWLWKIAESLESRKYRCGFLEKLNRINSKDEVNRGMLAVTYPVSFSVVGQNGRTYNIPLYVKETRAGYEEAVPYTMINEIKIMRSIIYDMFSKYRSPHFVFPIYQLMVDSGDRMEDTSDIFEDVIAKGRINPRYRLCSSKETESQEKLAIYNFMEYLPPQFYSRLKDFAFQPNVTQRDIQAALFQVFYNLAVMEKLQFRHGDLHPGNVMVANTPENPWRALYVVDDAHIYQLTTPVFTAMIDFDRSYVHSEKDHSIDIPDEILLTNPCVPTGGLSPERAKQVMDDCWKTWNPYGDLTRFILAFWAMWRFDPRILEIMFPDERLRADVLVLLGDYTRNVYGYPSLKDLEDRVPRAVLDRLTPQNLFSRYAEQLASQVENPQVTVMNKDKIPSYRRYRGLVFFVN